MYSSQCFSKDTALGYHTFSLPSCTEQGRTMQTQMRSAVFRYQTIFLMEKLSNSPVNVKQIKQWTVRVPILSQVKRFLMQGWPPVIEDEGLRPYAKCKTELSVQDGCILWWSRVVVPATGPAQVMDEVHLVT